MPITIKNFQIEAACENGDVYRFRAQRAELIPLEMVTQRTDGVFERVQVGIAGVTFTGISSDGGNDAIMLTQTNYVKPKTSETPSPAEKTHDGFVKLSERLQSLKESGCDHILSVDIEDAQQLEDEIDRLRSLKPKGSGTPSPASPADL